LWFRKPDLIVVLDIVEGTGEHDIQQFWHAAAPITVVGTGRWAVGNVAEIAISSNAVGEIVEGWQSDTLGSKKAADVLRVSFSGALTVRIAASIRVGGAGAPVPFVEENSVRVGEALFK